MVAGGDEILATDLGFAPIMARKTVDEDAPTSSAAVQDDDELFVAVKANSTYFVIAWIRFTAASNTPDLRVNWSGPAGSTISRAEWGHPSATTTSADTIDTTTATTGDNGRGAGTTEKSLFVQLEIVTGVTAGSLKFRFGQVTSSVDKVTVKAGSRIIMWKYA